MVRLVFRPYTQVWRSICTLEPLRASIRVSPDFTLLRHSSPSFGSQRICSYSNLFPKIRIGRWCTYFTKIPPYLFSFLLLLSFLFIWQKLTYTLHSLVRVSRRGDFEYFDYVLKMWLCRITSKYIFRIFLNFFKINFIKMISIPKETTF